MRIEEPEEPAVREQATRGHTITDYERLVTHLVSIGATYECSSGADPWPEVVPPQGVQWLSVKGTHFICDECGAFLGIYSEITGRFNPLSEMQVLKRAARAVFSPPEGPF